SGAGRRETAMLACPTPPSGTSRDSTRSGDPANVTVTPRARSASPIARAGRTWPAVPPAAITHRSPDDPSIDGDVKENADGGEEHHETRAAVRDERQRYSGERGDAERGGEVDRSLAAHERGDARREELAERVLAAHRDADPRERDECKRADHERVADDAELIPDDREDHVGVGLRQVRDLAYAFAQPCTGHP